MSLQQLHNGWNWEAKLPLSISEDSQDEFEIDETKSFQITRPVVLTICATFLGRERQAISNAQSNVLRTGSRSE